MKYRPSHLKDSESLLQLRRLRRRRRGLRKDLQFTKQNMNI